MLIDEIGHDKETFKQSWGLQVVIANENIVSSLVCPEKKRS